MGPRLTKPEATGFQVAIWSHPVPCYRTEKLVSPLAYFATVYEQLILSVTLWQGCLGLSNIVKKEIYLKGVP